MPKRHCVPLGPAIARGRPFAYLPQPLQTAIAAKVGKLAEGCVFVQFLKVECKGESSSFPNLTGTTRSSQKHASELCWTLSSGPIYKATGLTSIEFAVEVDGSFMGIGKLLKVEGKICLSAVGPLMVVPPGIEEEFIEGSCPWGDCTDQWVHGHLACELTGRLRVSSELKRYWNSLAVLNWWLWLRFPSAGVGSWFALGDIVPKAEDDELFEVNIAGPGPNGGAVYRLGPFKLTPA
jgi:hypothetical protein